MPGHVKKGGKQEADPDPSPWLIVSNEMRNNKSIITIIIITGPYMQKPCDVAGKAILAKINLRKKCVNRDKM